jgi:hypothetical protein
MTAERPKHLLWRANLLDSDLRTIPLLRLVHALASYEHHVSVVLYDKGLSLLHTPANSEIAGMLLTFPLYHIDLYVVTDTKAQVPAAYQDQIKLITPSAWTTFLSEVASLNGRGFEFLLPALPGVDAPIDGLL